MTRLASALVAAVLAFLPAALACGTTSAQEVRQRKGFSIEITEPYDQALILGKIRIAASVKIDDPRFVDRVEFLVGDAVVFVDREPPWECSHDFGEESRSWIVRAVAYHTEGVSVSDTVVSRKPTFTAVERVNRVILWVSARDPRGEFVTDLRAEEFRVFENDKPQSIIDFYVEERPITLAILLDTSGSIKDSLKEVHQAASAFVETLRADDRALVIDFDDRVFLTQDLTSDHAALKEAITSTEALGGTALYDALHAAYRKIGTIEGRKAMILLSDGDDSASQIGHDRILEEAKSNNTMIFSIGLVGQTLGGGGMRRGVLKELSEITGGRAHFAKNASELAGVYQKIADELSKQYYLTYSTDNEIWDGRWIKIRVESGRPDIEVRARAGYFAVRAPTSAD